jgi:hypothetical protein
MKTQFGNRILETELCVLCGEREATTKEHIPPKGLFITKPSKYLSVPACAECNNSTKLDDEYLLQTMAGGSLVGDGIDVWKKKVSPKLRQHPKTKAGLRNRISKYIVMDNKGILSLPAFILDQERIEKSIRKFVYGVYWFHTGLILPKNTAIVIRYINPAEGPEFFSCPENMAVSKQMIIGVYNNPEVQKTFFYTWAISEELALFNFFFYKQNLFIAGVPLHS